MWLDLFLLTGINNVCSTLMEEMPRRNSCRRYFHDIPKPQNSENFFGWERITKLNYTKFFENGLVTKIYFLYIKNYLRKGVETMMLWSR